MTPQQPHPLRCETCNNWKGYYDVPFCKYWDDKIPISKYGMDLISRVGCASHSDASNPEHCADTCIYKRFAKNMENAERHDKEVREKALDDVIKWMQSNCVVKYTDEGQPYFCVSCVVEFRSLRGNP